MLDVIIYKNNEYMKKRGVILHQNTTGSITKTRTIFTGFETIRIPPTIY